MYNNFTNKPDYTGIKEFVQKFEVSDLYDNERWTWFQYSPVSDLWISEERRAKDDEMCTLIKNTAKQLGINLQSSLEQAAELLADNEFEDI